MPEVNQSNNIVTFSNYYCECTGSKKDGIWVYKSGSFFIDINNSEVVCLNCGLVSPHYVWFEGELYEK